MFRSLNDISKHIAGFEELILPQLQASGHEAVVGGACREWSDSTADEVKVVPQIKGRRCIPQIYG